MIFIPDKPIVYCDVDDTLVMWEYDTKLQNKALELIPGTTAHPPVCGLPNEGNIEKLKTFKARGHTVVVWSQGGSEWAKKVVELLELGLYVDIILPKPFWFIDDLPASDFMDESKRLYNNS